jgi:hypothetical protein
MKRIVVALVAITMGLSGTLSPVQANHMWPVQCASYIDTVLYYEDGAGHIVGEEVTYCDGHVVFLGAFGTHSWTDYCGCSG